MIKKVYSTGEVAEICKVSQQTIIRCFDAGLIRGFRVPGSRFRRVPHEELIRFMSDNGIDTALQKNNTPRLLVVTNDQLILSAVSSAVGSKNGVEIRHASDAFDTGASLHERYPDYVVVDLAMPGIDPLKFAHAVRPNGLTKAHGILAIDPPPRLNAQLREAGVVASSKRPLAFDELRSSITAYLQNRSG